MCDPATLTALTIASTAITASGTVIGGIEKAQQERAAAKVADQNVRIAADQSRDAQARAQQDALDVARKHAQAEGAQRAAMAANGIDPDFGSGATVQSDAAMLANEDANRVHQNLFGEMKGFDASIANYQAQASADRASATGAIVDSLFSAGGTILGGAAQVSKIKMAERAAGAAGNVTRSSSLFGGGISSFGGPMNTRGA